MFSLNGDALPWVDHAKYLGNTLTNVMEGFSKDCKQKRARYIERNCELIQEFHLAHPEVRCKINRIYNSSFPGSVLWDFSSENFSQIVNSWSVSVRHMWGLSYATHKYLIEALSGQHAMSMLISRYVKFIQSMKKSPKIAVQFLVQKVANNCNTLTGRNVRFVCDKIGVENIFDINPNNVKKKFKFSELKEIDAWRANIIKEITNIKQKILSLDENEHALTNEDLDNILDYACTT